MPTYTCIKASFLFPCSATRLSLGVFINSMTNTCFVFLSVLVWASHQSICPRQENNSLTGHPTLHWCNPLWSSVLWHEKESDILSSQMANNHLLKSSHVHEVYVWSIKVCHRHPLLSLHDSGSTISKKVRWWSLSLPSDPVHTHHRYHSDYSSSSESPSLTSSDPDYRQGKRGSPFVSSSWLSL